MGVLRQLVFLLCEYGVVRVDGVGLAALGDGVPQMLEIIQDLGRDLRVRAEFGQDHLRAALLRHRRQATRPRPALTLRGNFG